jgi:poly-gamma-glutamate capsule biosynthesis protein CapA/YwtB (metallophosphatase superfamily)
LDFLPQELGVKSLHLTFITFLKGIKIMKLRVFAGIVSLLFVLLILSCNKSKEESAPDIPRFRLVLVGQSLIKIDPRKSWDNPFGTVEPILKSADVCFTNFEMAVDDGSCGVADDYTVVIGEPKLGDDRPGNTSRPHAVKADVMEFLSSIHFNLMSLANNHAWDLGDCGVKATIASADTLGVTHAGTGTSVEEAISPAYLTVKGLTIALIAATTSHDERNLLLGTVNGVWTGYQEDWDRNIAAVEEAAQNADFIIYYHHFQIDDDVVKGQSEDGHLAIGMTAKEWQYDFAKAIIDAGASMYLGHGHRGFDGVEIYNGRPLFRQLGGFAYQGISDEIGHYDDDYAWWGLLANMTIRNGYVRSIEFFPLELDEGDEYSADYNKEGFLTRRGFSEVAKGSLADDILQRFVDLSKNYGANIRIKDERAYLEIN